jgi:hypothetical protein
MVDAEPENSEMLEKCGVTRREREKKENQAKTGELRSKTQTTISKIF